MSCLPHQPETCSYSNASILQSTSCMSVHVQQSQLSDGGLQKFQRSQTSTLLVMRLPFPSKLSDIRTYLLWQAHKQLLDPANYAGIESGLTWLGVAGLIDPPRPEVKGAIEDCVRAGIRVRCHDAFHAGHATFCCQVLMTDRPSEAPLMHKLLLERDVDEVRRHQRSWAP